MLGSLKKIAFATVLLAASYGVAHVGSFADRSKMAVDAAVTPVMVRDTIPGMSVGVIAHGKTYFFSYGTANLATKTPVTDKTLFEIGSISKTFTATLAAYAFVRGDASPNDPTSRYFPTLSGTPFGSVTLLNLLTHTSGGFPLQVPGDVRDNGELIGYLKAWRPAHAPGTYRTYSNVSIGFLGLIAARSLGGDFEYVVRQHIFAPLGMRHSYITVPAAELTNYAEGYRNGSPIRMTPGVLWQTAYGVRTTISDLTRFVEANVGMVPVSPALERAIADTHAGYFRAGPLTQALVWEEYPFPVSLRTLIAGNPLAPVAAVALRPPVDPSRDLWINKTGSTNGFGAYVAFLPQRRCGVVLLANENYPIADRVTIAHNVIASLC